MSKVDSNKPTFCELCLPTWFVEGKWLYFAAAEGDFEASSQKLSLMGDLRLPWFKDVSFCVPSCAEHKAKLEHVTNC